MRRAGGILSAMAFATALLANIFGRENAWLLATFGITLVLGSVLLAISSSVRLYRGDLKIRPWHAAKTAVMLFLIILALRLLARVVFPSLEFDLTESILASAVFASFCGLYITSYRKPA